MNSVIMNASAGVLEVTVDGFLSVDEVNALGKLCDEALRSVLIQRRRYTILADFVNAEIQSGQAVSAFQDLLLESRYVDRIAVVTPRALLKLQMQRLLSVHINAKTFDTVKEAMTWLLD